MRETCRHIIESLWFQRTITWLIIINGIILGLATSKELMAGYGTLIENADALIVALFTVEITMRIFVHRLSFFKDPWSLFDFFVVAISLIPTSDGLSVLRALRVLRLFRLLTIVPQMRTIIAALIKVIPGIGSISMILMLFFYVFSIMATNLFGEGFPQWFGTLGNSMYTLFQIMTLESWSMGISRPVMEIYPYAWLFFVIFILVVTFVMVNLFIGIIVDAIFTLKEEKKEEDNAAAETVTIESLKADILRLESLLERIDKRLK